MCSSQQFKGYQIMSVSSHVLGVPIAYAIKTAKAQRPKEELVISRNSPTGIVSVTIGNADEIAGLCNGGTIIGRCGYEFNFSNIERVTTTDGTDVLFSRNPDFHEICYDLEYKEGLVFNTMSRITTDFNCDLILTFTDEYNDVITFTTDAIRRRSVDTYELETAQGKCYEFRYKDIETISVIAGLVFVDNNPSLVKETLPGNVIYGSFNTGNSNAN